MKISNRIASMQESPIRKLMPYANKKEKEGKKIYYLNIGQPDIETPPVFMEAIRNFDDTVIRYSPYTGNPDLLKALVQYYKNMGASFEEEDIIITNGSSEAIIFALMTIADSGDNIIIPEPLYTNYNGFSLPIGIGIKPIATHPEEGFKLPEYEEMEKLVDSKTKAILFSNPGNPTGVVYTKEDMEKMKRLALEHDLFIMADEVYRDFVYDNIEYSSFSSQKEVEDRVIVIDSVSKKFSACGARVGHLATKNKEFINGFSKLCMGRLSAPTLGQVGATALYSLDQTYFDQIRQDYQKRRDTVYNALTNMEGVQCKKPAGSFYIMASLPVDNAEDFIVWMIQHYEINGETLILAPAQDFYANEGMGKNEVRIAYILETEELKKAMAILEGALKAYPHSL